MTTDAHTAALDLVAAATQAHIATRLGWPHHARDTAARIPALTARLTAALDPLCTPHALDLEEDERRTGVAHVFDELQRRHIERAAARAARVTQESSDGEEPHGLAH